MPSTAEESHGYPLESSPQIIHDLAVPISQPTDRLRLRRWSKGFSEMSGLMDEGCR